MTAGIFIPIRTQRIESLNIEAQEYKHAGTGARHIHLAADDSNNVFAVALPTVPQDSTGVAHILEHTTLCGSKRYPVRDPFFMMTRRSLNTFMNAFTGSDWTAYPFASQNRKDFNNLLKVYLDAVFFPNLHELDFAQEGHRLEFTDPKDPTSELVLKGVVYNEMKGAMSSPIARLWHTLSAELFPTTTYHYNSGGEPEEIPKLTYAQLKEFHARHYHPSNAFFATYGDIPAAEHQTLIHELALQHFTARHDDFRIPDEQRYTTPRCIKVPYALDASDAEADKTHVVLGWLLGNTTELMPLLEMHLLSGVLLDHSASPLRHALETTELGNAPSELCGLESGHREASFVCGLEGTRPEDAQAIEQLVLDVIMDVAENGVPQEMLEAVLHQMEISQREIRGGSHPYGLQLLEATIPIALHGGDPLGILDIEPVLEKLRLAIQDPNYIKGLVSRWLLDNPHRVQVVMTPDPDLAQRQATALRSRLQEQLDKLSADERRTIVDRSAQLAARQASKDDPDILPRVTLDDVPPDLKIPAGQTATLAKLPVTWFRQGTNGIIYQSLILTLPALSQQQTDLLRLFSNCYAEVGCGTRDYRATQQWHASVSGGLSAHCSVRGNIDAVDSTQAFFRLDTSGLARKQAEISDLLQQSFSAIRFDELDRVRELVAQLCASREASVTDHGHTLAAAAAASGLSRVASLHHGWDGLLGLQRLKALNKSLADQNALKDMAEVLHSIHEALKAAPRQLLVISEAKYQDELSAALQQVWSSTPAASPLSDTLEIKAVDDSLCNSAWLTSTEVNFCSRAYATVPPAHPDSAALIVLGRFLHNGYLHRAIREQGGAYGSGASYDGDTGTFRFYSYRDPRLGETLEDFDRALEWLQSDQHEFRQLEEAVLSVISSLDRPGSPAGEAMKAFISSLFGRTPEYLRSLRQRILSVTIADLQRVAETYLQPQRARTAVLTSVAQLQRYPKLSLEPVSL